MTSDNLAFGYTFEKEHLSDAIKTAAETLVKGGKGGPLRVAGDYVNDGMKVDAHSSFGERIKELFAKITPQKIVETGTYLGMGTTTIIAKALKELRIKDAVFYTIEVNPEYYAKAKKYFRQNNIEVYALNGLSVPRAMLPSREEIASKTITDVEYDDIFVDHEAENRAQLYYDETNFANVEDDLLGRSLKAFEYKPDFVLLDSAGHMGNIEFNFLIERLRGPCYIALDDIYHIKHHRSFRQIQSDPRFEVITASKEKFGFCIAKFTPAQDRGQKTEDRRQNLIRPSSSIHHHPTKVLIVRPDAVGDFVIFSGVLHYFRKLYSNARISLLVQKNVAELANSCPHIDEVILFDRKSAESDRSYFNTLIEQLRAGKFDVAINCSVEKRCFCARHEF